MSPEFTVATIGCGCKYNKTAKPMSNKTIKREESLQTIIQLANSVKVSMNSFMPWNARFGCMHANGVGLRFQAIKHGMIYFLFDQVFTQVNMLPFQTLRQVLSISKYK